MATITLGTNANNTLTAVAFSKGPATLSEADIATIAAAIKWDGVNGNLIQPDSFERTGLLYVPRRGVLKVLPGDYVGVDSKGWPILVSSDSIAYASTSWTHT